MGTSGTNPRTIAAQYDYRPSDDYYLSVGEIFLPENSTSPLPSPSTIQFAFEENEAEGGSTRVDYVTLFNSSVGLARLESGSLVQNDPRITLNISQSVTTAEIFPEVPAGRWESSNLILETLLSASTQRYANWQFKKPLPLNFELNFSEQTYTPKARIPSFNANVPSGAEGVGANGRFIHIPTYYQFNQPQGAMCAVHGVFFGTFQEEKDHNSLYFQLQGGTQARTFNGVTSQVAMPANGGGSLNFTSNSEVGGLNSGRVYYPAITKATASFTDANRLLLDITSTVSPTVDVLGVFLRDFYKPKGSTTPPGSPLSSARFYVDHYEDENGQTIEHVSTQYGDYVPATKFFVVFEEGSERSGYIELRAIVDAPEYPPEGDTLLDNWNMAIPALLYVAISPVAYGNMIVRPSGEYKSRPKSILWQHSGLSQYWAGELPSGNVLARNDEDGEWIPMANAWDGVTGAAPKGFTGLPFKGAISIARVEDNLVSRYSPNGVDWETPVVVRPWTAGSWAIASHEYSGSDEVTVMNLTTNEKSITDNRGMSWEVVA